MRERIEFFHEKKTQNTSRGAGLSVNDLGITPWLSLEGRQAGRHNYYKGRQEFIQSEHSPVDAVSV